MNLSVIIPAYNHLEDVMRCLNSLHALKTPPPSPPRKQGGEIEVEFLIQDDCSPEYFGPAVIPGWMASCERNAVNVGFAGNCNVGAARATGDVLLFVNQDVYAVPEVSPGWDAALLAAFDPHPPAPSPLHGEGESKIGIVGARLLFPDGSIQSAGGIFDGRKQPHHRCLGWSNPYHEAVNGARQVSWVTGAALAIRRELFVALGGFDVAYQAYFEDVDLCVRAQLAGFECWYAPGCTLIHEVGSTGGSVHFRESALRFRDKWANMIEPDTPGVYERFW